MAVGDGASVHGQRAALFHFGKAAALFTAAVIDTAAFQWIGAGFRFIHTRHSRRTEKGLAGIARRIGVDDRELAAVFYDKQRIRCGVVQQMSVKINIYGFFGLQCFVHGSIFGELHC